MIKKIYLLTAIAALFCFTSCDKDDDKKPVDTTQNPDPEQVKLITDMLTAHDWQLSSLTQNTTGSTVINDIYNTFFPNCQKDDVYTFAADNKITIEDGVTRCGSTTQTKNGTWALKNGVKSLNFSVAGLTQPGLTGDFDIVLLTNTQLTVKQTSNGTEFIATYSAYTKPVVPTKTQMLTSKPWKITAYLISENGGPDSDIFYLFSPCDKDNIFKFTAGRYSFEEGATTCDPMDPQVKDAGDWSFINNETKLILDSDKSAPEEYEILQLDSTTLKLKFTEASSGGGTNVYKITFTAL